MRTSLNTPKTLQPFGLNETTGKQTEKEIVALLYKRRNVESVEIIIGEFVTLEPKLDRPIKARLVIVVRKSQSLRDIVFIIQSVRLVSTGSLF